MSSPGLQRLTSQLDDARAQTDSLFSLLDPAALYDRPVADRHRLIFYLGHVEAFDWNLLSRRALDKPSFHPGFDKLFAFGIDPEPGRAPADQPSDWPSEKEVRGYCSRVREELDRDLAASGKDTPDQLLHVAIEHRLMHAETLAYLFHNLPYESKRAPAGSEPAPLGNPRRDDSPKENSTMLEIPAGIATLGRPTGDGFGWDNEFDRHSVEVPAFRISRFKISNGEYLEYLRFTGKAAHPPHFWIQRDGRWFLRAMFGEIPLPLDWPVYVTHQEASAVYPLAFGHGIQEFRAAHGSAVSSRGRRRVPRQRQFRTLGSGCRPCGNHGGGGEVDTASRRPSATDGSGPPPCSLRFPASSRFRFIPATPPIFSMASIS